MYHRWHLNYPFLILILGLLLVAWAVTYTIANTPDFSLSDLWSAAPQAELATAKTMVEVAPGFAVPRDYYIQEKMYRERCCIVTLSPASSSRRTTTSRRRCTVSAAMCRNWRLALRSRRTTTSRRRCTAKPRAASVTLAPGFTVPEDYYIQEKMYREETSPQ